MQSVRVEETARIRALHRYAVLDTPEEVAFDRITRLASEMLEVPIALVSFVDTDRQWFKSRVGLDVPETSRNIAFCAHAILDGETMIVTDATRDPRFKDNPLVTSDPSIRFYAGAQLEVRGGHNLGTLCVIDVKPRSLDTWQRRLLEDLAGMVTSELELRLTSRDAERRSVLLELGENFGGIGHWMIRNQRLIELSIRAQEILELPVEEPVDLSIDTFLQSFNERERSQLQDKLNAAFDRNAPFSSRLTVELQDGTTRQIEINGRAEIDPRTQSALGIFGVVIDITERERLRTRMHQAEKMASIGTLAAGVAHEINNPLTYIKGNVDVMSEELCRLGPTATIDPEFIEMLADVSDGAQRIQSIVQGLKSFARTAERNLEPVDLFSVLTTAERLCAHELRQKARFVLEVQPKTPPVWADEGQLVQVAVNLLVNAAHAVPRGGVRNAKIIARCGTQETGEVFLEILDTGRGMSKADQRRALEPFYTTKPVGIGTGLGLSIANGIIKSFGGTLEIDSTLGVGTRVRIKLPAHRDGATGSGDIDKAESSALTGLRILYIDGDQLVGRSVQRILRDNFVVTETTPERGIERLRDNEKFDVVLCDLLMENLTGDDFFRLVAEGRPDLLSRIIFVSGSAFKSGIEGLTAGARVVTKPIDRAALTKVIRRMLGR